MLPAYDQDVAPSLIRRTPHVVEWRKNRLPVRWILPDRMNRFGLQRPGDNPLNITDKLTGLGRDIVAKCPTFKHIDLDRCQVTFTNAKSDSRYGLQARLTPMRLEHGQREIVKRGKTYRVQEYRINDVELLYMVTFCMPRFLELSLEEKFITFFHELYHIGEKFDGDLRRHEGRCHVHTGSKKKYDAHMGELVEDYLKTKPNFAEHEWLNSNYESLWQKHGGLYGVHLPMPRMVPAS